MPARSRGTVRWAAARGERCMLWDGSAIAYWYQVIVVGAAAVWAGSFRGWMRGCRQSAHGRVGQVAAYADSAPAAQLATVNIRRRDSAIPPV